MALMEYKQDVAGMVEVPVAQEIDRWM